MNTDEGTVEMDTKKEIVSEVSKDTETSTTVVNTTENTTENTTDNVTSNEGTDIEGIDGRNVSVVDTMPAVEFLTIRNLDTGEAFVIGQNDPDFDFNTFALGAGKVWGVYICRWYIYIYMYWLSN